MSPVINLLRPKSATFTKWFSPTRQFRAARSLRKEKGHLRVLLADALPVSLPTTDRHDADKEDSVWPPEASECPAVERPFLSKYQSGCVARAGQTQWKWGRFCPMTWSLLITLELSYLIHDMKMVTKRALGSCDIPTFLWLTPVMPLRNLCNYFGTKCLASVC